jgi:hypothetical protein
VAPYGRAPHFGRNVGRRQGNRIRRWAAGGARHGESRRPTRLACAWRPEKLGVASSLGRFGTKRRGSPGAGGGVAYTALMGWSRRVCLLCQREKVGSARTLRQFSQVMASRLSGRAPNSSRRLSWPHYGEIDSADFLSNYRSCNEPSTSLTATLPSGTHAAVELCAIPVPFFFKPMLGPRFLWPDDWDCISASHTTQGVSKWQAQPPGGKPRWVAADAALTEAKAQSCAGSGFRKQGQRS